MIKSATPARKSKADPYVWHLRGVWAGNDWFSHRHWWKKSKKEIDPFAGRWELMRRHPKSAALLRDPTKLLRSGSGAHSLENFFRTRFKVVAMLSDKGHLDWLQFTRDEKQDWKKAVQSELPPQSTFDEAPDSNIAIIGDPRFKPNALREVGHRFSEREEQWLMRQTQACHDRMIDGQVLIAFDPTTPGLKSKLTKMAEEIGSSARKLEKLKRDRKADWLQIISDFENDQIATDPTLSVFDSQVSARYRRVIERLTWPESEAKRSEQAPVRIGRVRLPKALTKAIRSE